MQKRCSTARRTDRHAAVTHVCPHCQRFHLTWIGKRGMVKNFRCDSLSSVDSKGLKYQDCEVLVRINKQSLDIASGVHVGKDAVSLVFREPKHQETTAYWHVRRCESRGDQNGTNDTADAAAGDNCGGQGKSFKTKSVREVLEVHVQKGSPDVQTTVFRETSIQMRTRTVSRDSSRTHSLSSRKRHDHNCRNNSLVL